MSTLAKVFFDVSCLPRSFKWNISPLPIISDSGSLQISFIHVFSQSFVNHLLIACHVQDALWNVMNIAVKERDTIPDLIKFTV